MAVFTPSAQRIQVGPGTLYAAPIGTTEPTAVSGAWPAGWVELGYTDKGNDRSWKPTVQEVTVDEEIWPVRNTITEYAATVMFSLAENTAQNAMLALNAGIGSSQLTAVTGVNPDGSIWVEPPTPGSEQRIMLGWDLLPKGATSPGNTGYVLGRSIYRQCLQTGELKMSRQKGNQKALITITFALEFPATTLQPFRDIFPASLAS